MGVGGGALGTGRLGLTGGFRLRPTPELRPPPVRSDFLHRSGDALLGEGQLGTFTLSDIASRGALARLY